MSIQQEKFTKIADAIREKTGTTDLIKPSEFASKVSEVFDAGKQSEYDTFWDSFQDNGNRGDYSGLFSALYNPKPWFRPKYDLKATRLYQFIYINWWCENIDFVEWFNELGVTLDTSKCTDFQYAFCNGKRFGVIDTTATTNLSTQVFWNNTKLTTIDELIVKETTAYGALTFQSCSKLANLKITGTIGKTITLSACPLTVESAKSVIRALKNYAGTDEELTCKITLKSTVWDALNEAEAPPSGETWKEYVQTLGWQCA